MSITSDRIREYGFIHDLADAAADEIYALEAEIDALQSKADVLAELLIKATIDEWQPGFTNREYDSDETEENEFRERVLSILAAYNEQKQ